jgi:hypothetical protein
MRILRLKMKLYIIYESLFACRDYFPYRQFENVISNTNSLLAQYKDERVNEIQKTVNSFSKLYTKTTSHDFSYNKTAPSILCV